MYQMSPPGFGHHRWVDILEESVRGYGAMATAIRDASAFYGSGRVERRVEHCGLGGQSPLPVVVIIDAEESVRGYGTMATAIRGASAFYGSGRVERRVEHCGRGDSRRYRNSRSARLFTFHFSPLKSTDYWLLITLFPAPPTTSHQSLLTL
jgi:hypothetical protein